MKFIIQNDRIIATVLDSYTPQGFEQAIVDVPDDYNELNHHNYIFYNGELVLDIKKEVVEATQRRLDDFAKTKNYDNIVSACTYATSTDPIFSAEGQRAVDLRTATWRKLYEILAEVDSGARPTPTKFSDIESELPTLSWE